MAITWEDIRGLVPDHSDDDLYMAVNRCLYCDYTIGLGRELCTPCQTLRHFNILQRIQIKDDVFYRKNTPEEIKAIRDSISNH